MNFIKNLFLLCIVMIFCILAGELALTLFFPIEDPFKKYKESSPQNLFIKRDFKRNYELLFETEDGLPGLSKFGKFTTNNVAFRGDSLISPKPHDEYRIFMVGGSTTECLYLDDSESIDRIVQNLLNEQVTFNKRVFKVFNAGKSAEATPGHISKIVHRIVHLEPDMIIVFAGINDLTRGIEKYDYANPTNETIIKNNDVEKLFLTEYQLFRRLYFIKHVLFQGEKSIFEEIGHKTNYYERLRVASSVPFTDDRPNINTKSYLINLKTITGVTIAQDIDLIFMTQQTTWDSKIDDEVSKWQWMLYRHKPGKHFKEVNSNIALKEYNNVIRKICLETTTSLIDLAKLIPKSTEYFYDDVHFNIEGSKLAGSIIANYIIDNDFVEPVD